MFSKPEFPLILFVGAGLLIAWPMLEVYRQFSPLGRLSYFFVIWGLLVLAQAALSRYLR